MNPKLHPVLTVGLLLNLIGMLLAYSTTESAPLSHLLEFFRGVASGLMFVGLLLSFPRTAQAIGGWKKQIFSRLGRNS